MMSLKADKDSAEQDFVKYKQAQIDKFDNIYKLFDGNKYEQQQTNSTVGKLKELLKRAGQENDIILDFKKKQEGVNDDLQAQLIKMVQRMNDMEKFSQETLNATKAKLEKQIVMVEQKLFDKVQPLMDLPGKIKQVTSEQENQDLAVHDLVQRMEKIETLTENMQNDIKQTLTAAAQAQRPVTPVAPINQQTQQNIQQKSNKQSPEDTNNPQTSHQTQEVSQQQIKEKPLDLKYYIKKTIQETDPISKQDLSQKVMEMIKQAKRDEVEAQITLEAYAKQLKKQKIIEQNNGNVDLNESNQSTPQTAEKNPEAPKQDRVELILQKIQFEWSHLPSQIEQLIEEHVRQINDHVVYLDQIRPRFRQFELASEMNQIFSHFEVQTYQQDLMLKQSNINDLKLLEMNYKIDELSTQLSKYAKKIDATTEGRVLDQAVIDIAESPKPDQQSLVQVIMEMKTEILLRCTPKEQMQELEAKIQELEKRCDSEFNYESKKQKEDLAEVLEQMQTFPKMLQSLQLQIMRSDTNLFELNRSVSNLDNKLQQMSSLEKEINLTRENLNAGPQSIEVKAGNDLDAQKKIFQELNLVKADQHQKLKVELDEIQAKLHNLENQILFCGNKVGDHTKNLRSLERKMTNNEQLLEELKVISEKAVKDVATKIDSQDFNEELRYINASISQLDIAGKVSKRGDNLRPIPKRQPVTAVAGGGLSKEDKQKLDNLVNSQEKTDTNLRVLAAQIRSLNLDDFKSQLKILPSKADIKTLDQLEIKLTIEIQAVKAMCQQVQDSITVQNDKLGQRITRLIEQGVEKSDEIQQIKEQFNRVEDAVQSMKRKAQTEGVRRKLAVQTVALLNSTVAPVVANAEGPDEFTQLEEKVNHMNVQLMNSLQQHDEKIRTLMRQTGADSNQKQKNHEIKKLNDQVTNINNSLSAEMQKLQQQFEELQRAFQEKIRRQALVVQKKLSPTNSDEELMKNMRSRPKFMAQQMTRELVLNGRLPNLESYGDHLARYGKGFSQMLNIAGDQRPPQTQYVSPRLMEGFSLSQIGIYEEDMKGQTKDLQSLDGAEMSEGERQRRLATIQSHANLDNNKFALNILSPSSMLNQKRRASNRSHLATGHKIYDTVVDEHQIPVMSPHPHDRTPNTKSEFVLPTLK